MSTRRPNGSASSGDDDRLDEQRHHVAQRAAEQQGEPADRGDPGALDDAGPQLGDEAEALEQAAEDGEHHQQAGHEDLVGLGVWVGALSAGLSSGAKSSR